jgi:hypothetical protein
VPALSPTECITPAFRHTVRQVFQPFRFGFWVRIAILGLFAGEIGGGGGFNVPSGIPSGHGGSGGGHFPPHVPWNMGWFTLPHILMLAAVVGLAFFLVMLVFLYINSIFRFILFDAVLRGNALIGEGWRRWRDTGRNFFVWQLLLGLAMWGFILVLVALPLFFLLAGHHLGRDHIDPLSIVVLVLGVLAVIVLAIIVAIVAILAKDFLVPIMALERVGWQEAWGQFRAIARGHASEYVIYFLMKFVLRIGAGIAHGIIVFLVVMILAIPAVIAVVAGIAIGVGASMAVKALLITIGIVAGILFFAVTMAFSAFVGAPIAFFFPAYSIYFFAGRYEPLGRIVFPAPPPPVIPPEISPLPA